MEVNELGLSARSFEDDPVKRYRHAFAFWQGRLWCQDSEDNRPMHIALREELGVDDSCLGGYQDGSNIVFFMRDGHADPDESVITEAKVMTVYRAMRDYVKGDVAVWSGVVKEEPGRLWLTKKLIGYVRFDDKEYREVR